MFVNSLASGGRRYFNAPVPWISFQGTTGIAKQATQSTFNVLRGINEFFHGILNYLTGAQFVANIVATAFIIVLGILFYRLSTGLVPHLLNWRRPADEPLNVETLARIKRQDTAITLIRNILRYTTFSIVALLITSIFLRQALPAVAGASILAALIGFSAQSFLRDIIAGFFILFEGQYSVGDFITVEPMKVSGIVEEFGLRTTKIRTLSGELFYVPNGVPMGVSNYIQGYRRFNIEVYLKDPESGQRVLETIDKGQELYLTPPQLVEREEFSGGKVHLRIQANVLPSMDWLVEKNLVEQIKAAAGDESLAADPMVYTIDRAVVQRVKGLTVPGEG